MISSIAAAIAFGATPASARFTIAVSVSIDRGLPKTLDISCKAIKSKGGMTKRAWQMCDEYGYGDIDTVESHLGLCGLLLGNKLWHRPQNKKFLANFQQFFLANFSLEHSPGSTLRLTNGVNTDRILQECTEQTSVCQANRQFGI